MRNIAKVVRKFKLGEEERPCVYWRTRPVAERIEAVELLRQEFHGWTDETEPRLSRVCRRTQLA